MSRQAKTNELVTDQFPVFELDGYTKRSGETDFTVSIWRDGVESAVVVSIVEIAASGEYKLSFTPDASGYWYIEILVGYNKDVFSFEYDVSANDLIDVYDLVRRTLGLGHENIFIDNTVFDGNAQLVSARTRIFDTKAHCDAATDGGSETDGLIASYFLTTQWEALNKFQVFRQTREV